MSRIDDLLREHCPGGVEFRNIGEIAEVGTGSSDRKDLISGGEYPFYVRSKNILKTDHFEFDEDAIVIPGEGGIGEIFHFVSGKYALHQRAYRISFRVAELETKFAFYYFSAHFKKFILMKALSATVTSIRKPMITDFRIPVPPLQVQREIVRILESFGDLEAELETELAARIRQSAHYQRSLTTPLASGGNPKPGWVSARIGDLCRVEKGRTAIQQARPGPYPLVATSLERQSSSGFDFDGEAVCVPLVSSKGHGVASISRIFYQSGKFALGTILAAMIPEDSEVLSAEYLYRYLQTRTDSLLVPLMRGGANVSLTVQSLKSVPIQVPPIGEQREIVRALSILNSLLDDQTAGLPAELAARRKQHEYYRDKLLTFEEAPA